jgi:hypothetical protein
MITRHVLYILHDIVWIAIGGSEYIYKKYIRRSSVNLA